MWPPLAPQARRYCVGLCVFGWLRQAWQAALRACARQRSRKPGSGLASARLWSGRASQRLAGRIWRLPRQRGGTLKHCDACGQLRQLETRSIAWWNTCRPPSAHCLAACLSGEVDELRRLLRPPSSDKFAAAVDAWATRLSSVSSGLGGPYSLKCLLDVWLPLAKLPVNVYGPHFPVDCPNYKAAALELFPKATVNLQHALLWLFRRWSLNRSHPRRLLIGMTQLRGLIALA